MITIQTDFDDWKEWRRFRALELKSDGWPQHLIASALGVSKGAVSQWLGIAKRIGPEFLRSRSRNGPLARLSNEQMRLIPELLWHGAEAYGFRGEVWTCARVASVIHEEFGVLYHKDHVGRLLKALGWTPQMPIRRALQRDEKAISEWRSYRWPELVKEARKERRVLVFEDESGFYLLPGMVRTYAPRGHTPVIRENQTRDHLSVMGGMTLQGRIYTLVKHRSLNGNHSIEFLTHLQKVAGNRLLVIWDGSPIHRRHEVIEFVQQTHGRVRLESLPGYAPDLNPWDEGGWNYLKNVEMRNAPCHDLEELHEQFHLALGRLRSKPNIILAFFAQAGLAL